MSGDLSQEPRTLAITTSTGKEFVLRRVEAVEAISRPFLVQVEVLSKNKAIKASEVVGHTASVSIQRGEGEEPRWFNGYISAFRVIGSFGTEYAAYGLEIVPKFWNLSRTSDCRVFQNESVPTIVKKLVQEGGADAPVFMSAPDTPRPYCIQYNETDLDFCQRLMDETGCGYYWLFGEGEHTMMVASAAADYLPISGNYIVKSGSSDWNALSGFRHRTQVQPGAVAAMDYNLIKHSQPFTSTTNTAITDIQNAASFEMRAWPGGQQVKPEASPDVGAMQTYEAEADIAQAVAFDPVMTSGCKIKVALDQNAPGTTKEYLLTRVVHSAHDETHLTDGGGSSYTAAITMIPAERPFRPSSPRPRPVVPGLQSAIVVGKAGEEIHTDAYGRIKIRFLWDRLTKKDDTACEIWVRVAQPAAGKWGGTFFLPRMGDEVLVGFVDGDPDKPVVVGSLYSEDAPLAGSFPMPSKKTRTGMHSRSSKGGSGSLANIIYFDDNKGAEEVYLRAQKDMNVVVEDARTELINVGDNDGDDTYKIMKGDKWVTVAEGDFNTFVDKGDYARVTGEGDDNLFVKQGDRGTVVEQGDYNDFVKQGDRALVVDQGDSNTFVKQGDQFTEVNSNITTKAKTGNITMDATAGKIDITAAQSITLKVGGSSIKIDTMGVTIEAPMVTIKAQTALKAESGLAATFKGTMVTVEGSGPTMIKGAVVLIN
ncbi:type VI secretion system tip protein VgrG [Roseomonas sp. PWR1]|uniref:Type VI secretion system tip protein VgrG n=1 Tax=Roseomonas nitratireducens TaxID=2820810 RepID=A0ABS4AUH4_9PROT|nr:type VI secretion system tip protein TssI/VgrG [Neoroseomonas nitratireducens]MBP0464503.1 type VI secretion system tip protein VgrG [Neoroseomonas nitratireducens]